MVKKLIVFVLALVLINSVLADYNFGNLVNNDISGTQETPKSLFIRSGQTYIKNKAPITTANYPNTLKVVNGNTVEFKWSYQDLEGDNQINYQLELDDNSRFLSPLTYFGLIETTRKIYISEGNKEYFWRIKSKDDFGWGEFSEAENFYLDSTKKVCEDGTPYSQCSLNNFKYCDAGELKDDCRLCGCPLNNECNANGKCIEKTCFDGTKYGFCNINKKPNFCQNGQIKEVCSLCGCSEGLVCNSDGTCDEVIVLEEKNDETPKNKFVLIRFSDFLKRLFKF